MLNRYMPAVGLALSALLVMSCSLATATSAPDRRSTDACAVYFIEDVYQTAVGDSLRVDWRHRGPVYADRGRLRIERSRRDLIVPMAEQHYTLPSDHHAGPGQYAITITYICGPEPLQQAPAVYDTATVTVR
ncbi:MAG: hypothetical protein OXF79_20860 [Chloroflexi bacterium]|nr:hypothetical protein [Chloroflexota bacterium]